MTFRFQQLLGDFKEDGFRVIKEESERENLIDKCLKYLEELYKRTSKPILVTSDSKTFLEIVSNNDYVYVIPGNIRHMDFSGSEKVDIMIDMKSYVDLFLLANADSLYRCVFKPLYGTSFSHTASFVFNKDHYTIGDSFKCIKDE